MAKNPTSLYLDLMRKCLSFLLWPEPPQKNKEISMLERVEGRIFPKYAHTMIGLRRLYNLQMAVETIIKEQIDGDLIETGVWRGGASILMRAVIAAYGEENRKVFVADSFEGLPEPDIEKYPADKGSRLHTYTSLAISQQEVEENFRKYGLLDKQVVFLKGWFKDTLPNAPISKLAVMRLDGDMYGSTMEALECLYPKLSIGGFCIIDDYALPSCKAAVHDYLNKYRINIKMEQVDWTGIYWRKE